MPDQPGKAIPADDRPVDPTPVDTADLPPTPLRDRNIPASAWRQAPPELLTLGNDIGNPLVAYKRRIGPWILWRAGPARRADARYMVLHEDDLTSQYTFRLFPDGTGEGTGPSGDNHGRFRTWKEDLLGRDPSPPRSPRLAGEAGGEEAGREETPTTLAGEAGREETA